MPCYTGSCIEENFIEKDFNDDTSERFVPLGTLDHPVTTVTELLPVISGSHLNLNQR